MEWKWSVISARVTHILGQFSIQKVHSLWKRDKTENVDEEIQIKEMGIAV